VQLALYLTLLTAWVTLCFLACRKDPISSKSSKRLQKDNNPSGDKGPVVASVSRPPSSALDATLNEALPAGADLFQAKQRAIASQWQRAAHQATNRTALSLTALVAQMPPYDNPAADATSSTARKGSEGTVTGVSQRDKEDEKWKHRWHRRLVALLHPKGAWKKCKALPAHIWKAVGEDKDFKCGFHDFVALFVVESLHTCNICTGRPSSDSSRPLPPQLQTCAEKAKLARHTKVKALPEFPL
jgi:hypothetical protein